MNAKLYSIRRHPSIIVEFVKAHKWKDIENSCARLDEKEALEFISSLKKTSPYQGNQNEESKLNRLCYVEDWQKKEIRDALSELLKLSQDGIIHRKDWEWALGIIALNRFGKLNDKSTAIGIGSGTEPIPFYLANKINHVYATDIYRGNAGWERAAPSDFPENINDKEHPEFFNRRTIYSDLINKLEKLQLVEPLDLRITTKTLDTMIDYFSIDANWDKLDDAYKKTHPLILVRVRNLLFTSLMLVFQKS